MMRKSEPINRRERTSKSKIMLPVVCVAIIPREVTTPSYNKTQPVSPSKATKRTREKTSIVCLFSRL